jgi:predicted ATP-grasp superfamily ATP-dependent carboligase
MIPRTSVLVTDGEQRAALAVVRSLGKAGYAPIVCSRGARSLAGVSRYAMASVRVPDPLTQPDQFRLTIADLVRKYAARVVVPVTDMASLALLGSGDLLPSAVIAGPSLESFRAISDKAHMLAVAREIGLATPTQLTFSGRQDATDAALDRLEFPVVLKPTQSVRGGSIHYVSYAVDRGDLRQRLNTLPDSAYPLLIQQRIVGPGTGLFLLRWGGRIVATFAHERLRETPPSGGASVYSQSVAADPDLVAGATRLLDRFDWRGVAMIELKREITTGRAYVIEVNGRLWGSLQLAIDAGVDFPALLVNAAMGEPLAVPPVYRTGVRLRWWWGDVNHLLVRLRHTDARLSLPPNAPSRATLLRQFFAWRPGDRNETLRVDDPRPFLIDTMQWVKAHVRG